MSFGSAPSPAPQLGRSPSPEVNAVILGRSPSPEVNAVIPTRRRIDEAVVYSFLTYLRVLTYGHLSEIRAMVR